MLSWLVSKRIEFQKTLGCSLLNPPLTYLGVPENGEYPKDCYSYMGKRYFGGFPTFSDPSDIPTSQSVWPSGTAGGAGAAGTAAAGAGAAVGGAGAASGEAGAGPGQKRRKSIEKLHQG